MRIILVPVSLALLVIVSAVPVRNLKDELKDAAEQTWFRMIQVSTRKIFSVAKTILDNNLVDPLDKEKIQHFVNYWGSRNESLAHDKYQIFTFTEDFMRIVLKYPEDSPVVNAARALIEKINLEGDPLDEFQRRATEMIRVAKEAGYTDDSLNEVYDEFAQSKDFDFKDMYFRELVIYLNVLDKSTLDKVLDQLD